LNLEKLVYHLSNLNKGDFEMDQNIRASLQISAFYNFAFVVFITAISQSVTLMAIVFGDLSGKENVVAASVVLMAFIGSFGIIRQMSTIKLLIDEMDDKTSKTNYGKEVKAIPLNILKFVFAGVFVIIAIFQLVAIY
jgi:hypothetical protein|tara:strand:- start:442 stop:852 length:411 start_codon:yes stop_codon:yes gene_type:complete